MAEVAALGLAANVFQFISLGGKVSTQFWRLYTSGQNEAIPDLPKITNDLHSVLNELRTNLHQKKSDQGLKGLAEECQKVAEDFQALLSSLVKAKAGKLGKREAFITTVKTIWKEDEIQSFQERLDNFRNQLIFHLLASMRNQAHQSLQHQQDILKQLDAASQGIKRLESTRTTSDINSEGFGALLLDFLASKLKTTETEAGEENQQLKRDLIAAIYGGKIDGSELDSPESLLVSEEREQRLRAKFLSRLEYALMDDRENRISEAHSATFQWIFEDEGQEQRKWSNFKTWLESSDSQLYWMTGKAGSGKSTLMKYICQSELISEEGVEGNVKAAQPRSTEFLEKWAAGTPLITAVFFFWNSGESMQMKQSGLFRTLLSQIFLKAPHYIPVISPKRWESLCFFGDDQRDWTDTELEQTFRQAVSEVTKQMKLCLFVDGLDEFNGDHKILVHLFKDITSNSNLKCCVSSRPWTEFEDGLSRCPSLMLQDLTYNDIKGYISSELLENEAFRLLHEREPLYANDLVENVISKASGVFLWVRLVVSSLITGISHGDRVSDLQKRLDLLPPDLEELYGKILSSLDPFYLEHATQLFKLIQESPEPPPLLVISFADEEDPQFAFRRPVEPMSEKEASVRVDTMRRRLNSRCKGLLEASRSNDPSSALSSTVQYLHRTVKDYLEREEVHGKLQSNLSSSFDPHLRLATGHLAAMKCTDKKSVAGWSWGKLDAWNLEVRTNCCLYSISRIRDENQGLAVPLVNEISNTARFWKLSGHLNIYLFSVFHRVLGWDLQTFDQILLLLSISHGISGFVEDKIDKRFLFSNLGDVVLLAATYSLEDLCVRHASLPNPEMVALLLKKGADAKAVISSSLKGLPVWECMVLEMATRCTDGQLSPAWVKVAKLMHQQGVEITKLGRETYPLVKEDQYNRLVILEKELEKIERSLPPPTQSLSSKLKLRYNRARYRWLK